MLHLLLASDMIERAEREGAPLGECPHCEEMIPAGSPVVAFEPAAGWPLMLAECPACEEAVQPA